MENSETINHPDLFKVESPMVNRKAREKSAWRKFRDVFGYHYASDKERRCKNCRFVKWNWVKRRWICRLQVHRIGPFWVCLKWKKILE